MKASFTLGPADKAANVVVLIAVMAWAFYPAAIVKADNSLQNPSEQALVFEVKSLPAMNAAAVSENTDKNLPTPTQPVALVTYDQLVQADPLVKNLRAYLERHKSPLAVYAGEIVLQPQWQRALAISWGESNFGIRCHSNNCSGIGGSPRSKSWRKYATKLDWFKDMSALLEKPIYKERYTSCRTMNGVYNKGPRGRGSANWLRACEQKSADLIALTQNSEHERLALIESLNRPVVAAASEVTLK